MFTRRHHEKIAETIKKMADDQSRREIARNFAVMLYEDNTEFGVHKFNIACGLDMWGDIRKPDVEMAIDAMTEPKRSFAREIWKYLTGMLPFMPELPESISPTAGADIVIELTMYDRKTGERIV